MTGLAKILSIAGSDPSGGAGVQGDLKTFFGARLLWHGCVERADGAEHPRRAGGA